MCEETRVFRQVVVKRDGTIVARYEVEQAGQIIHVAEAMRGHADSQAYELALSDRTEVKSEDGTVRSLLLKAGIRRMVTA